MRDRPVLKLAASVCLPTGFGYTGNAVTRPKPLTRPGKFQVEYRSIEPARRTFLQFAAEPDAIRELHGVADQLQDMPRESAASMQDVIFFNRRMAKRIRVIADRIEMLEPKRTATVVPIARRRSRLTTQPIEQLAMF